MKEQLVAFQTARLAKEKGFDWSTNKHYQISLTEEIHPEDGKSGPFGWEKDELSLQDGYFINNWRECDTSNSSWYLYSTPTQSLLQRWIEEDHTIIIDVNTATTPNEILGFKVMLKSWKFPPIEVGDYLDKYEGIEEGLQKALKLI